MQYILTFTKAVTAAINHAGNNKNLVYKSGLQVLAFSFAS